MRRLCGVMLGMAALATLSVAAEPRWCSITGRGPNDTIVYPPIARAARVWGNVIARLVYTTDGKVVRFEEVSGPKLLSSSLSKQFESWSIKTDATGQELCESLVSAEFRIESYGAVLSPEIHYESGSVLRIHSEAEPLVLDTVISDPAPLRGFRLFRSEVRWKLHRAYAAIFNHHESSKPAARLY